MSSDENVETVRRLLGEVFSQGKYELVDQLVAPDFVEHQNGVQGSGSDALLSVAKGLRASFPDLRLEIQDVASTDDTVWVRARVAAPTPAASPVAHRAAAASRST